MLGSCLIRRWGVVEFHRDGRSPEKVVVPQAVAHFTIRSNVKRAVLPLHVTGSAVDRPERAVADLVASRRTGPIQ